MLERLDARARRLAQARAAAKRGDIADRLRAGLPAGVSVAEEEEGVGLLGRRLKRRAALDPALRGLLGRLA